MEHLKQEHERGIVARLDSPEPSIKDVGDAVKLIIDKMWTEKRMSEFIESKHNNLCKSCKRTATVTGISGKAVTAIASAASSVAAGLGALAGALMK